MQIRQRNEAFPIANGNSLEWAQPVSVTHIHKSSFHSHIVPHISRRPDFNLREIAKMVYYHNGPDAEKLLVCRYQCIKSVLCTARAKPRTPSLLLLTPLSIWKPLKSPVRDWPLALCDAKTIDSANDLVTADVVYQDHSEEKYQVHYKPKQRWFYLSDQQPSEMLVFSCADFWEEQVGPGEITVLRIPLSERWYLITMS